MSELYVHVPAALFPERVDFLLARKLQPEVACQDATVAKLDLDQLADSASALAESGLKTVLHAPFVDFLPGAADFRGRQKTISLLEQTLILAERIKAEKIVFHPGLSPNATLHETDDWLTRSYVLWSNYISWAKLNSCIFCIENIYETSPTPLLGLISAINSPYFGHVFDIGHWNIRLHLISTICTCTIIAATWMSILPSVSGLFPSINSIPGLIAVILFPLSRWKTTIAKLWSSR